MRRIRTERLLGQVRLAPTSLLPGWLDLKPQLVLIVPQINELAPDLFFAMIEQKNPRAYHAYLWLLSSRLPENVALLHFASLMLWNHLQKLAWRKLKDFDQLRDEVWLALSAANEQKHGHREVPFEIYVSWR